jgi:hypothetical protein
MVNQLCMKLWLSLHMALDLCAGSSSSRLIINVRGIGLLHEILNVDSGLC